MLCTSVSNSQLEVDIEAMRTISGAFYERMPVRVAGPPERVYKLHTRGILNGQEKLSWVESCTLKDLFSYLDARRWQEWEPDMGNNCHAPHVQEELRKAEELRLSSTVFRALVGSSFQLRRALKQEGGALGTVRDAWQAEMRTRVRAMA